MIDYLFSSLVINLGSIAEYILFVLFLCNIIIGLFFAVWQLRSPEGREAVLAWLAVEDGDPAESLITMLTIPTLGLLVVLCSS